MEVHILQTQSQKIYLLKNLDAHLNKSHNRVKIVFIFIFIPYFSIVGITYC